MRTYRKEIDGLRAFAVLPVMLFHAGFEIFGGGFIGVDVFFVISGYLITSLILAEMSNNSFSLINFYERRARRLLPALFFVMLLCLPFAWLWLAPENLKNFGSSLVAVSSFVANFYFWFDSGYFSTLAELQPLLHTWSLALEEQYYIFFPIFILASWQLGIKWILSILIIIFLISISLAHWGSIHSPNAAFFLLPTRAWELLIGVFIAFYLASNPKPLSYLLNQTFSILGFAMIVVSLLLFDDSTPFPSFYALIPTVGAGLIIISAVPKTYIYQLLTFQPIVGLGLISYSAYLWHQPIFSFARHRHLGEPSDFLFICLFFFSLITAYASWRWIENPFRDIKKISKRSIYALSLGGIVFFISVGSVIKIAEGYPERLPEDVQLSMLKVKNFWNRFEEDKCNLGGNNTDLEFCIIGSPSIAPNTAVIGDSHAAILNFGLDKVLKEIKVSSYSFTKNACPLSTGFQSTSYTDCWKHSDKIFELLQEQDIKTVILFSRWSYYLHDSPFDNGMGGIENRYDRYTILPLPFSSDISLRRIAILSSYKDMLERLTSLGLKIIVIGPVPEHGWNISEIAIKNYLFNRDSEVKGLPIALYNKRNLEVLKMFKSFESKGMIDYIDPAQVFCSDQTQCAASMDKENFYIDSNHLSSLGSQILANQVKNFLISDL